MRHRKGSLARSIISLFLAGVAFTPAAAQDEAGDAAFLFAYELTDATKFETAYAEHLKWHAASGDRLPWFGWTVASGPRSGVFINGSFGISFAAFDRRPDIPGDIADARRTIGPYSRALGPSAYLLWRPASTSFTLEQRKPTALMDVYRVKVAPGDQSAFERAVRKAGAAHLPVAWYRGINGVGAGSYLLMVPRVDNAGLGNRAGTFADLIRSQGAAALVRDVEIETWRYRPALSLLPEPKS